MTKKSNADIEGTGLKVSFLRQHNDLTEADVDEIVAIRKAKYEVWYQEMIDKLEQDAYDQVSK